MIYLDNSATTKISQKAKDAMMTAMDNFGNPSSLYNIGFAAQKAFEADKATILKGLGAKDGEIIITSGGTESNNLAIIGTANAKKRRGTKIITTSVEHPSVIKVMEYLEKHGFTVIYIDPINGEITADMVAEMVDKDTVLVSVMAVNNETGAISPVEKIARAVKAKKPDVIVHCDNVQGFLKKKIVAKNIDLISVSSHKIGGPKGVGALFVKKGVRLVPIIHGGGQQKDIRPGTESTLLTAGFAAAVADFKLDTEKMQSIKSEFLAFAEKNQRISVNSTENSADFIINFSVLGIKSETMLHFLEGKGIYVSSGSACSKGKKSQVLKAFNIPDENIDSAIRISFGVDTGIKDIKALINELENGIKQLQTVRK